MVSGWVVEIIPGERYTYGTQRDGEWRHRFDFDLTSPVVPSPGPVGAPPVGRRPGASHRAGGLPGQPGPPLRAGVPGSHHPASGDGPPLPGRRGPDGPLPPLRRESPGAPLPRGGQPLPDLASHPDHRGIDLRHDHRIPDGRPETGTATWYGAHTPDAGTAERQEFLREGTQNGAVTGWAIEIVPDERYTYGTIRDGEWVYRLDFDLTAPVETPPAPWGHEER
jgi:hypothetical protein